MELVWNGMEWNGYYKELGKYNFHLFNKNINRFFERQATNKTTVQLSITGVY
jgi:hypothetical protein